MAYPIYNWLKTSYNYDVINHDNSVAWPHGKKKNVLLNCHL